MITHLISLFLNKKTPCFVRTQSFKRITYLSVFVSIFVFTDCKKKEVVVICNTCTVKFKESSSGFEGSLPFSTLEECEEAKTLVGKTTVENGLTITITEVVCK